MIGIIIVCTLIIFSGFVIFIENMCKNQGMYPYKKIIAETNNNFEDTLIEEEIKITRFSILDIKE